MANEKDDATKVAQLVVGRDEEDLKRFGKSGTIYLGKHLVGVGEDAHVTTPLLLDVLRPHMLVVTGKRGCMTKDSMVFTDKGFKPIAEFDEKNDLIYSYDVNNKRFDWKKSELVRYNIDSDEEMIDIFLRNGQRLTITSEHPLLIFDGKNTVWKKAIDITSDDIIVTVENIPEVKNDTESSKIARLLGFLLSDGTLGIRKGRFRDGRGYLYNGTIHRLRIFNGDMDVLQQAANDLKSEFGIDVRIDKKGREKCYVLSTKQSSIVKKFVSLGVPVGKKSHIIRVPSVVWTHSNEFKANFLRAAFSCDGYISKNGIEIDYYSNSRAFLADIQLLLLHFDIKSTIKRKITTCNGKKFTSYVLFITDRKSSNNFRQSIGFVSQVKNERLFNPKTPGPRALNYKKCLKYLGNDLVGVRIDNITRLCGVDKVYDLSVNSTHSFLANGIVSHNTGKSYSLGIFSEELMKLDDDFRRNLCAVMVDTQGIFWTMKNPNEKDASLLTEWGMKPQGFATNVFVPEQQKEVFEKAGVQFDGTFSVDASELSSEDWLAVFELDPNQPLGILLQRAVSKLRNSKQLYSVDEIIASVRSQSGFDNEKMAVENRLEAAKTWGIFGSSKMPDMLVAGRLTILDVSLTPQNVRALMVAMISRKIYRERTIARRKEELAETEGSSIRKVPMCWIMIDEAHNFIPNEGKTAALEILLRIVKEGRQPGITLVLATQRPEKLHPDALAQTDLILSHRITSKADVDALRYIMQTYMTFDIGKYLNELPKLKGTAIILDDNSERIYTLRVRPRQSWHAGSSPVAVG
ncbi:MAG: LAGLIDADG family homing endonuclease [Candidatus Aenigmatarchaeota archaeon]